MLYAYTFVQPKKKSKTAKAFSTLFFFIGILLVGIVAFPVASWQIAYVLASPNLLVPIVREPNVLAAVTTNNSRDFTDPNNWFDAKPVTVTNQAPLSFNLFTLSIPKLKIKQALVEIGGVDLKKSLIAWPSSVAPGAVGSVFIFGHSALPIYYSPNNYTTIFTHIYDLDYDEPIIIEADGVTYKYVVESKKIIAPTDLSILEQKYDAARLVMVTCLPAGTYLMRGVVTAKLLN